jgi:hypothetical protein
VGDPPGRRWREAASAEGGAVGHGIGRDGLGKEDAGAGGERLGTRGSLRGGMRGTSTYRKQVSRFNGDILVVRTGESG